MSTSTTERLDRLHRKNPARPAERLAMTRVKARCWRVAAQRFEDGESLKLRQPGIA